MSSKNTFYFSHDANAHEDDKIICLMSEYGSQGYGWWWILVEILFQQEGCMLDLSKKSTTPYLSRMLWDLPVKDVPKFIDSLIEYGLLSKDGDCVYSESLLRRNQKIEDLRDKRRAAANKRWEKKKPDVIFKDTKTPKNGIAVLKDNKRWREFQQELLANPKYAKVGLTVMDEQREVCLNWLASKGVAKKDYKAFFRNWLLKHINDNGVQGNSSNQMVY